jgi:hypothetical protein
LAKCDGKDVNKPKYNNMLNVVMLNAMLPIEKVKGATTFNLSTWSKTVGNL